MGAVHEVPSATCDCLFDFCFPFSWSAVDVHGEFLDHELVDIDDTSVPPKLAGRGERP